MISESVLHFVEYELQAIALTWMAVIYTIKVVQLMRMPMPWEQAQPRGSGTRGIVHSYGTIFVPQWMESSRRHVWRWIEFSVYHVGALVAIVNTFTFSFTPWLMTPIVRLIFAILIAPAIVIGLVKLARRVLVPELRIVSTPDDYFSLVSLEFFFFAAVMALVFETPFWRMAYFLITAAFLFYVPFSKISHYVYFFFSHYLTGKRYGWRGVAPQIESRS